MFAGKGDQLRRLCVSYFSALPAITRLRWLASQRLIHLFQFKSTGLLDLREHEYKR
jgi:hypothetical protein